MSGLWELKDRKQITMNFQLTSKQSTNQVSKSLRKALLIRITNLRYSISDFITCLKSQNRLYCANGGQLDCERQHRWNCLTIIWNAWPAKPWWISCNWSRLFHLKVYEERMLHMHEVAIENYGRSTHLNPHHTCTLPNSHSKQSPFNQRPNQ